MKTYKAHGSSQREVKTKNTQTFLLSFKPWKKKTIDKQHNFVVKIEKKNARNKSRNKFLKRNKTKQIALNMSKRKEVDSYLRILHILNVEDETQTDGKTSAFCL